MKKLLFFFPMACGLLLLGCKKDSTATTTTETTSTLQAYINGTVWTPDTLSASITYDAAAQTKLFTFTGTKSQKQIIVSATQTAALNNNDFPVTTFTEDNTNTKMAYYTQQLTTGGNYAFVLQGSVLPGSGKVSILSIDTVAKTITGTYSFTATKKNYDANGNYVSIDVNDVTSGTFNAMPYTFKRE